MKMETRLNALCARFGEKEIEFLKTITRKIKLQ